MKCNVFVPRQTFFGFVRESIGPGHKSADSRRCVRGRNMNYKISLMVLGALMFVASTIMGNIAAKNVILSITPRNQSADIEEIRRTVDRHLNALNLYRKAQYVSPIGFSLFALGSILSVTSCRPKKTHSKQHYDPPDSSPVTD